EQVCQALGQVHPGGVAVDAVPGVGVADGPFAAVVAAAENRLVPAGESAQFLAPLPIELLGRPDLADLLRRLGLTTLGRFAALPAADVVARFGPAGASAHRLARGVDDRPLLQRQPPPDLAVSRELDPPAEHADQVAFAARRLAEQVQDRLVAAGLACSRILVEAQTTHGQQLGRYWRHDGPLSVSAVTDRIRWQVDGWLAGSADAGAGVAGGADASVGPVEGVVSIRLVPDQLLAADGRQLGLWGEAGGASGRVERAVSRVQGLLGPAAVLSA
nr:DNA polymerase Y family protein [Micromonospora sp. DSM 115978]